MAAELTCPLILVRAKDSAEIVVFKSSDNRENLQFHQFPMKLGSFKYDRD